MFRDKYSSDIGDGFEVDSTSSIDRNISIIESCGVKVKDVLEYSGEVCYIPTNERDLKSRKMFLAGHGFLIEDNHIVKKR